MRFYCIYSGAKVHIFAQIHKANIKYYVFFFGMSQIIFNFAAVFSGKSHTVLGLTGFDSGLRWYVSMRSGGCTLHNPFGQKFIWRKQVRSRCLIEVQ